MQIGILEADNFSDRALENLSKIGRIEIFDEKQNLEEFLKTKNILFIRLNYFINKDFLSKTSSLKYICTPTTGLNHIDLNECKKRNIKILSLKGEYEFLQTIRATPEHTFGLLISLLRNYKKAFLSKENSKWDRNQYRGFEIYQNTIGIIGLGRIGKILAKYFTCFGAKVFFYDINEKINFDKNTIKRLSSLEELIAKSNIVLLTASYSSYNEKFINSRFIDLMKDKYFINTARGELVDEDYLLQKIQENWFKGIAIDVISNEQMNQNNLNKFLKLNDKYNLILTSHIGGATFDSMHRTEEFIVNKLLKKMEEK